MEFSNRMICYIDCRAFQSIEASVIGYLVGSQSVIERFQSQFHCIGLIDGDGEPAISATLSEYQQILRGPRDDQPFILFNPAPFQPGQEKLASFIDASILAIALIDGMPAQFTGVGDDYVDALKASLRLKRCVAMTIGSSDIRSMPILNGDAIETIPLASRQIGGPTAVAPPSLANAPGSRKFLLCLGFRQDAAQSAEFLTLLGGIEADTGDEFEAVILTSAALVPGEPDRAAAAVRMEFFGSVRYLFGANPGEWRWLAENATAIIVGGDDAVDRMVADELSANGALVVSLAKTTDAAAGIKAALAGNRQSARTEVAPSRSYADESFAQSLQRIFAMATESRQSKSKFTAERPFDLALVTSLAQHSRTASLAHQIIDALPDWIRLTLYLPSEEAASTLHLRARRRSIGNYSLRNEHDQTLCLISPATSPAELVNFALVAPSILLITEGYMLDYWHARLGADKIGAFARQICSSAVTDQDVTAWVNHSLPVRHSFLDPITFHATRIIAHGAMAAKELSVQLNRPVFSVPQLPQHRFEDGDFDDHTIAAARRLLGLDTNSITIIGFGLPSHLSAFDEILWAIYTLRNWGYPVQLVILAACPQPLYESMGHLIARLQLKDQVLLSLDPISESEERQFILAADMALTLTKIGFGYHSAALVNCLAAGLPAIANAELAVSADVPPGQVETVSDMLSALEIAHAIERVIRTSGNRASRLERRRIFCQGRTMSAYLSSLLENIGAA